jgi:hypothetical protein
MQLKKFKLKKLVINRRTFQLPLLPLWGKWIKAYSKRVIVRGRPTHFSYLVILHHLLNKKVITKLLVIISLQIEEIVWMECFHYKSFNKIRLGQREWGLIVTHHLKAVIQIKTWCCKSSGLLVYKHSNKSAVISNLLSNNNSSKNKRTIIIIMG